MNILRCARFMPLVILLAGSLCSARAGLRIWDGSSSGYWGNGLNWFFGPPGPMAGDDLVFPSGPSRMVVTNDYATNFGFNSLLFPAPGYVVRGNPLILSNGVHAGHDGGATRILLTTTLAAGASITASNPNAVLVFEGPIRYPSSGLTFNVIGRVEASNTVSQVIAGAQHVVKIGTGTLELAASNTFAGTMFVREGTVFANHDAALGIATGQGTIVSNGATLLIAGGLDLLESSISLAGSLVLNSIGGGGSASRIHSGLSFIGSGAVIDVPVTSLEVTGPLSGTNGFRVARGTLILSGNSPSFRGAAVLAAPSRLHVNAQMPLGEVHLDGGWLTGPGQAGSITSLAGGGRLTDGNLVTLVCSNLALNAATTCRMRVAKQATAVSTKLDARGTVSLGSCALDLEVSNDSLVPPDAVTLIANDGVDPVAGTFAGLPEGAYLTNFFTRLQISYLGGDGNDVVLTVVPNTRFWDGGGADENWQTPLNWDGNVRAHVGDNLVFPAGAARLSSVNNLGAGIAINSVTLAGAGYILRGSSIGLNEGLFATYPSGTSTVALITRLNSNQVFYATNGAVLNLITNIETAGRELTIDADGELRISGVISQGGSLIKRGAGLALLTRSNSYGGCFVADGTLLITSNGALGAPTAGTTVSDGSELSVNPGLVVAEPLVLGGRLKHNSSGAAPGFWTGPVTLVGAAAVIEVEGPPLSVTGVISGSGSLTKQGPGTLILTGDNTHSGATVISSGVAMINGSQPQSPVQLAAGVLGGTGLVGRVSASGTGNKIIRPGNGFGVLTTSNLLLNSFTRLELDLEGTIPGGNHDQIAVQGSINLGSCQLVPLGGSNLVVGQTLRIINNDGTDAVVGTFHSLPEGASTVASNGLHLRVSYRGGDGNDVEVTVVNPPSTIMRVVRTPEQFIEIRGQGLPNTIYTLEATTNLALGVWINVTEDLADTAGIYELIDVDAPSFPQRFYRVWSP